MFKSISKNLSNLCHAIKQHGGRAFLAGGCVRDALLDHTAKDIDLEIYGIDMPQLLDILQDFGHVYEVGKSFGVIKLTPSPALYANNSSNPKDTNTSSEIDICLPRKERKTAVGHQGFAIEIDPYMSPEAACLRRDFTINAMLYDPLSHELLDFYGGQNDLQAGILRHVSAAFAEDPLRVLRAMQFAARFGMILAHESRTLCQSILSEAASLAVERVWQEWRKWALADNLSHGLQVLADSGWLAHYPILQALQGCAQEKRWHPEGDVWVHTLLVCDQAARIKLQRNWHDEKKQLILIFAALCHDLAKPITSVTDDKGCIHSPRHAEKGVPLARQFLRSIGAPAWLEQQVLPLVREHLVHLHGQATARAVRRLSARLYPTNIHIWEALVEADASGRAPKPIERPAEIWLNMAKDLASDCGKPTPLVTGKLMLSAGIKAGKNMGIIQKNAYEAQLDGQFCDTAGANHWLELNKNNLSKNK
ncbi:MAG: HD domain-containing protein [Mariprofundales bacterium]